MKKAIVIRIAAAAMLVCWGDARASSASATLSNFRIELIDLQPDDQIDPYVTFQNFQGGTFVSAETGVMDAHGVFQRTTDLHMGGSIFGAGLSASTMGSSTASASIAGSPLATGASVSASASSNLAGYYAASTVMLGDGTDSVSFTLSPETRMVISGDASATVSSTLDDDYADAWASVFLSLTDYTGGGQLSFANATAEQGSTHGNAPFSSVDDRHLAVSFENGGSDAVDGIFFGSVDTSTSDIGPPSAVPEPATGALMLAAVGLLACMRRRLR
jgi:hypothetical protein